jgi:hypothetical protein
MRTVQNKKYAILSMQRVFNFGSVLQAYSLRKIIQELTKGSVSFLDIDETNVLPSKKTIRGSADYQEPVAYPSGVFQRGKRWILLGC